MACDLSRAKRVLTRDNSQLSRLRIGPCEPVVAVPIDWKSPELLPSNDAPPRDRVADLIANSIAANTRRAYASDLAQFEAWGGSIPATPVMVAAYLAAHAEMLSVATLVRRVATISKAHEARGLPNPCRSVIVRATLGS